MQTLRALPRALAAVVLCLSAVSLSANPRSTLWQDRQNDPVNWLPWGPEAVEAARSEDKPLFFFAAHFGNSLARAMGAETFANQTIAQTLNASAVPVLVDVNRHPELAATLAQLAGDHFQAEGWPTCLWTSVELAPLSGGSYFPPTDDWGGQGFLSLARNVAEQWETRRQEYLAQATDRLETSLARLGAAADAPSLAASLDLSPFQTTEAPTLPAVAFYAVTDALPLLPDETQSEAIHAMERSLERILAGAGFDSVEGGFFIGSNDAAWRLPLFQKSTADQALMLAALGRLHARQPKPAYPQAVRLTVSFIQERLMKENGLARQFVDSFAPGESMMDLEGSYYLLTSEDIESLTPAARSLWGLKAEGNLGPEIDILGVYEGQNVPYAAQANVLSEESDSARDALRARRAAKATPRADAFAYTATNAVLARSLAQASAALDQPELLAQAEAIFNSLAAHCADHAGDGLFNSDARELGASSLDYAYAISAALELHAATKNENYLALAQRWQDAWRQTPDFLAEMPLQRRIPALDVPAAHFLDLALPSAASVHMENVRAMPKLASANDLAATLSAVAAIAPAASAKRPSDYLSFLIAVERAKAAR